MTGLIWFSFSFAYPQYLCSFFFTIVPSLLDLGFRTLTYPTNPPRSGVLSLLSEPSLSYLSKLTVLFVEVLMSDCSVRLVRGCFPRKTCPLVRRNCPDFLSGLRRPDCPVRLSFCPVLKRFRKSRPATNPAVNAEVTCERERDRLTDWLSEPLAWKRPPRKMSHPSNYILSTDSGFSPIAHPSIISKTFHHPTSLPNVPCEEPSSACRSRYLIQNKFLPKPVTSSSFRAALFHSAKPRSPDLINTPYALHHVSRLLRGFFG